MTKFGETNGFTASDFVHEIEQYLKKDILDYCIVNTTEPSSELLGKYKEKNDELVKFDENNFKSINANIITGDFIREGQFVRHDSEKLAQGIKKIFES